MAIVVSDPVAASAVVAVQPTGGERVTFDPLAESVSNRPVEIAGSDNSHGIALISHDYPAPDRDSDWASNVDTDGERLVHTRYKNRGISLKLRVAEPPQDAGTNLISNPSFEKGTDGWTATAGSVSRAATGDLYEGEFAGLATLNNGFSLAVTSQVPVASGQAYTYTASMMVKLQSGQPSHLVYMTEHDGSGAQIGVSGAALSVSPDTWQRVTVSRQFGSAGVKAAVGIMSTGAGASNVLIDRVMLERSPSFTAYFDGDSPGCSWAGTPHASQSTRPATGGDRFVAIMRDLQQKVAGIVAAGAGTLRRQISGGERVTFDVADATMNVTADKKFIRRVAEVDVNLLAQPFGRGAEVTLPPVSETVAPALVFNASGVKGDVPALGRLEITELSGNDQAWAVWGMESKTGGSAAVAGSGQALVLQAEGLTKLSGATSWSIGSGATNRSAVGVQGALGTSWQAFLSTQINGGSHLSHVGDYRALAAVYATTSNMGSASVRLDWSQGDFRSFVSNDPAVLPPAMTGDFRLLDLGTVSISDARRWGQRWEGRLSAKSSRSGDAIAVDYLMLVPVRAGAGELSSVQGYSTPTVLGQHDEFDQSAGSLVGKTMASGGAWASGVGLSGPPLAVDSSSHTAYASAAGIRNTLGGTSVWSSVGAQVEFAWTLPSSFGQVSGLVARYVDSSNYAMFVLANDGPTNLYAYVFAVISGVTTQLAQVRVGAPTTSRTYTVRAYVLPGGAYSLWVDGTKIISGTNPAFARGGALASGRVGIHDEGYFAGERRDYDNFLVFPGVSDAAAFASGRAEVRYDSVVRQDSSGAYWSPASRYEGDYFYLPPAGRDNAFTRLLVKTSRGLPFDQADPFIDGLSAQVVYTPRYLVVPEE